MSKAVPIKRKKQIAMSHEQYITSDKNIPLGKPIIKGTRISVELIVELFANGWSEEQILESYPSLSKEAINFIKNENRIL